MAEVKLESRKPITIAYIEYTGSYSNIPFDKLIGQLYGWAKESKVMPGFYPMGIYHTNPRETPTDQNKMSIAISISGKAKPSGDVKIKKLPAMKVASYSHKGPPSEYPKSYDKLRSWMEEKGYVLDSCPIEVYSKKPEVVNGETIVYAKIMMPVKKATKDKQRSSCK